MSYVKENLKKLTSVIRLHTSSIDDNTIKKLTENTNNLTA